MHSAARHLADHFRKQAPKEFGKTFWYNCVYFVTYQEQTATIEEFLPRKFLKYVNNNGNICTTGEQSAKLEFQELSEKA